MAIRVRYEPAAVGMALASDLSGRGQLAKESQKFAFDVDRFQKDLAEKQREFDLGFDENVRQFGLDYALRKSGFKEGIRQFDLGHDLSRDQFSEGKRQFNVGDWLEKQKLLEGRRQYNLGIQEKYDSQSQQNFRAGLTQQGAWDRAVMGEQGAWGRQEKGAEFQQAAEQRQEGAVQGRFQQQQLTARMNSDWAAIQDNRRFWSEEEYNSAVGAFTEKYEPSGQPMPFAPEHSPPPGQAMLDEMRNSDDPDLQRIGDLSTLSPDGNSTMLKPGAAEIFKIQSEERKTERDRESQAEQQSRTIEQEDRDRRYSYREKSREYRWKNQSDQWKIESEAAKNAPQVKEYLPLGATSLTPGSPEAVAYGAAKQRHDSDTARKRIDVANFYMNEQIQDGQEFVSSYPRRVFSSAEEMAAARESGDIGQGDLVMLTDQKKMKTIGPGQDGVWGTSDDDKELVVIPRFGIVTEPTGPTAAPATTPAPPPGVPGGRFQENRPFIYPGSIQAPTPAPSPGVPAGRFQENRPFIYPGSIQAP